MNYLRQLRESKGLSQNELAKVFHTTQQTIHKYENGLTTPTISTLLEYSYFFHVSLDLIAWNMLAEEKIKVSEYLSRELSSISLYEPVNQEESYIINSYRAMTAGNQEMFFNLCDKLTDYNAYS